MKLRLKINPNLTREQLIDRLPAIIRVATEAVLEKGQRVHGGIEKDLFKAHPVKAIATSESEFYDQGHASLMGIYSWLSRSLDIETSLIKSFTNDGYKAEFQEKHGVGLGSSVTFDQAKKLSEVLGNIPNEVLRDRVRLISVDGKFGSSKKKYPNHGRYYEEHERVVLNPHIFGEETIYRDGKDKAIEKITHTLLHEIGHSIDDDFGFSAKKEWRKISGWKFIGDGEPSKDAERLLLQEGKVTTLKGKWSYRKGTTFARWYGARNPKEDFCEAFVFSVLGATQYFKGETGKKKREFVEKIIDKLIKSENPGNDLEASDDSEILKSQGFKSYYDTRSGGLVHLDELDAVEVAKSEFVDEACGEIYLEKADAPQPGAAPAPAPAPGAAPKANSGILNPLKGIMKPGHKYLYREPLAGGGYKYYYKMPNGRHFSSEDALHDEGKHMANFKSDEEWANYKQNITSPEQMPEVSKEGFEGKGGKQEFFDPVAVPNLVEDIKPDEKTFDPNAEEGEEEEGESPEAPEEDADWRHKKPSREDQDFQLTVEDAPKIEAALRTWEIEEVDESWSGRGIQTKFKVKLKNDGWAILKPKAGSLQYKSDPVRHMDDMTTIHREAMAYEIDKTLGWNLVPPTVVRDLKGVGNRRVFAAMKRKISNDYYKVLSSFKDEKMTEASLQFFAEDAELLEDNDKYSSIGKEETMRAVIFDMITNHQDRHLKNMMVSTEMDSENRYGGNFRFVLIDNGYMAGYGEQNNHGAYLTLRNGLGDRFIDKKTLRSLRKLRDDIRSKDRRRKILSEGTRKNITSNQIDRIAHRIDFILSPKFRDKKGRAQLPSWAAMVDWESRNLPITEAGRESHWRTDAANEPFDISGKTALVGKAQGKVKMFASVADMHDFLSPILPYLNRGQKAKFNAFTKHYDAKGVYNAHRPMREVIKSMPKKLVNQLFVKQLFHKRIGFTSNQVRKINLAVEAHLETDFVGEMKAEIKLEHLTAYNRMERGELELKDIKGLKKEMQDKIENLWLKPKNIRGVGKDLTDRIFDDPGHFGWEEEAPREKGLTPFEPLPDDKFKSQGEPELMVSLGSGDAQ